MQRKFLTVLAAAILAAPAATATWMAFGSYEPDTSWDEDDGLMVLEPDHDKNAQQLFFNVYQTIETTGMSANSATLGSSIVNFPARNFHAILGAWKDCNGDSYVGLIESALLVYPTPVLNATEPGICEVGSIHNDGQWVYEYVPFGDQLTGEPADRASRHPVQVNDTNARIWGDWDLPTDPQRGTCAITPLPHGTTASTGMIIRYADCLTSRQVAKNVNTVDSDGTLGIRFEDPENPQQGHSALDQDAPESLFGNPETQETGTLQLDSEEDGGQEEAAFTTFDCGQDGTRRDARVTDPVRAQQDVGAAGTTVANVGTHNVTVYDPTFDGEDGLGPEGNYGKVDQNLTDANGDYAWIAHVDPKVNDPTDSFADGLNATFRGFRIGGGDENRDTTVGGDCNTEADDEDGDNTFAENYPFGIVDSPNEGGLSLKTSTDTYFVYNNGAEQEGRTAAIFGDHAPGTVLTPWPASNPFTLGDAGWYGLPNWISTPQIVTRGGEISRPEYSTWYAKVGTPILNAGWSATGTQKEYGSEQCATYTSNTPSADKWSCNKSKWNTDTNGVPIADTDNVYWVTLGETYQFRDIDCLDGEVARGTGIRASLTDFSETISGPHPNPDRKTQCPRADNLD